MFEQSTSLLLLLLPRSCLPVDETIGQIYDFVSRERKVTTPLVAEKDSGIPIGGLIYTRLITDVSLTRVTVYDANAVPLDIDHSTRHVRPKLTARFYFGHRPIHHRIMYYFPHHRDEPARCSITILYVIDPPRASNFRENVFVILDLELIRVRNVSRSRSEPRTFRAERSGKNVPTSRLR